MPKKNMIITVPEQKQKKVPKEFIGKAQHKNTCTEEEAKEKECCVNRKGKSKFCTASKCMGWIWEGMQLHTGFCGRAFQKAVPVMVQRGKNE